MARYKRIPQNIGGETVRTAHRDFADICPACGGYIKRGQWYVMRGGATYHSRCKDLPDQLDRLAPKSKPKLLLQDIAGRKKAAERKKARKERRAEERRQAKARRQERERLGEVIGAQIREQNDVMSRLDHAIGKDE